MDATADAAREEADGVAAGAHGGLPKSSVPTGRRGDCAYQSHSARLGPVLCVRSREPLLLVHPRLGGEEGAEPLGARAPTPWLWVETVEQSMAVWGSRTLP